MITLIYILVFCLGMIIGSFLNVVIYRLNTGKSIGGRSMCLSCSKTLEWYELIPVVSFFIQAGRCRKCKSKISWQYVIVELSTAIIFSLITFKFLPALIFSQFVFIFLISFFMLIFSLLIVITVYDFRHKIIPNQIVYFFIFLSIVSVFINHDFVGPIFKIATIGDLLAGPLLATPFLILWLVSKGKWMGFGDIKLILGIGWLLGLFLGFSAILIAVWLGAIIGSLIIFLSHKKITGKTEIPFAPFLILGTILVFFTSLNLFVFSNLFIF